MASFRPPRLPAMLENKIMNWLFRLTLLPLCLLVRLLDWTPAYSQAAAVKGDTEAVARQAVLMISIDGLMPELVLQADRHALDLPVLRRFLIDGSFAERVVNVNPTVTNPNHTTLVTGVLPSEHGILNNRPFAASATLPGTYQQYSQIRVPTLWGAAKAAGLKTGSMFWPVTTGAEDIDFNLSAGSDEDDDQIVRDAIRLIKDERPELLTVHLVSFDHEQHASGPFTPRAFAVLERIDGAVGRIIDAQRTVYPESVIMIVSDHGFFEVKHKMNLNRALVDAGFISPDANGDVGSWRAFAWYVGGSAMVVLEDDAVRSSVGAFLRGLAHEPENGIERVYSRDEIASAGLASNVEFVVSFRPGYRMGTSLTGPLLEPFSGGAHGAYTTRDDRPDMHASLFVSGPGIASGRNLGIVDMRQIAPTIAGILGIAFPSAKSPPLPVNERPKSSVAEGQP